MTYKHIETHKRGIQEAPSHLAMISATPNFVLYCLIDIVLMDLLTQKSTIPDYSPQDEASEQEEQQWYSPSTNTVLKEDQGLHTSTAHVVFMLAMPVAVKTATADLQCFKLALQNKNMYIYTPHPTYAPPQQTRLSCERSGAQEIQSIQLHYNESNGV